MNYYEHHLGDYAQATAHLSFVEDAAYSRLIRRYYASEKPLPADVGAVQRLVGARSKEERAAVETVLREFFVLLDDGWHQARCDAEIARFQDKQDKAKRSANARWNRPAQHTEGNAGAMRSHSEGNALQTPDTRHQTKDEDSVPDGTGETPAAWSGEPASEPAPERSDGPAPDPLKAMFDLGLSILASAGHTERNARAFIGRMRKTVGDEEALRLLVAAKATTDPAAYIAKAMQPKPVKVQLC